MLFEVKCLVITQDSALRDTFLLFDFIVLQALKTVNYVIKCHMEHPVKMVV